MYHRSRDDLRAVQHSRLCSNTTENSTSWTDRQLHHINNVLKHSIHRPRPQIVDCVWNVMAHGDVREGKWRGNWRMEWVASTLHTTSEHGVSSTTTADAYTSAASTRLNWRPRRLEMDSSVSQKDEIWFLRVCHHISNAFYYLWSRSMNAVFQYIIYVM